MTTIDSHHDGRVTFGNLVDEYLATKDAPSLRRLRAAITAHPTFDPDLNPLAIAGPYLEAGRAQALVDELSGRMPGAFFSPATHTTLAAAYAMLGDTDRQKRERSLAHAAVATILRTGDGSADRPWTVLRVSDEYDLLRTLGTSSTKGEYVRHDGRMLDRLEREDGGAAWFAIVRPTAATGDEVA